MSEAEGSDADIGEDGCCVPESEMLVVKDLNMDYPWKGGNKYARVCPECRGRTFCAASYWETRDGDSEAVAYVIPKGEEDPRPLYRCPYTEEFTEEDPCGDDFLGTPHGEEPMSECPNCSRDLLWED